MGEVGRSVDSPELIIGLIGAVGTDLDVVSASLKTALQKYGYECIEIRLSQFLSSCFEELRDRKFSSESTRIQELMEYGDRLCEALGRGDALAVCACSDIQGGRAERARSHPRRAYVLRSLKRPDEVLTLREIYGPAFLAVSAYCPRDKRERKQAEKLAHAAGSTRRDDFRIPAQELIVRDEAEVGRPLGQNLREVFPLADIFVDASNPAKLDGQVARFTEILFGHPFITPTKDEFGMFHARAAALRSADMSRQVGAAIASSEGNIIAVGTNEVPKFGGGCYWSGDENDSRDFAKGQNTNREMRHSMIAEIMGRLKDGNWLSEDLKKKSATELGADVMPLLANTQVMDIGEFGRTVHAEMAAIVDAACRGVPVHGGHLFSTTFPCHNCAKHIIAAGIRRVVYIEPYPKSKAEQLHEDSISVDGEKDAENAVVFEPFIGIAPRRYIEFFTPVGGRQTPDGKPKSGPESNAVPRIALPVGTYEGTEKLYIQSWKEAFDKWKTTGSIEGGSNAGR